VSEDSQRPQLLALSSALLPSLSLSASAASAAAPPPSSSAAAAAAAQRLLRAPTSFSDDERWRPDTAAYVAPERCAPKDNERDWLPQLLVNVREMKEDDATAARMPVLFTGAGEEALDRRRGGGASAAAAAAAADAAPSTPQSSSLAAAGFLPSSSSSAAAADDDFGACGSGRFDISPEALPSAYGNLRDCLRLARAAPPARFCERTIFHAYWASPPAHAQAAWMVTSFLATQDPQFSELWLWSPSREAAALRADPLLAPFAEGAAGGRVRLVEFNASAEAEGSPVAGRADLLGAGRDERVWLEADLFRALVLFRHGGVYVDADVLLLRNLGPLLGEEWAYPWGSDCLESNNAVMRVFAGSEWARAILEHIGRTPPTRTASYVWGKEALRATTGLFLRLPPCFVNPLWMSNTVGEWAGLDGAPSFARSRGAFATHLHGNVFKLGERAHAASEYVAFKRALWARLLARDEALALPLRVVLTGALEPPLADTAAAAAADADAGRTGADADAGGGG
jgi:hypothetical protein